MTGVDGRVLLTGSNGSVFVSDALTNDPDLIENATVREGEALDLEIPRPPAPGDITVAYSLQSVTAEAGDDFTDTSGELTWLADDETPQTITINTIDDALIEDPEDLQVLLNVTGDLQITFSYDVTITDNEESDTAGIDVLNDARVLTSEDGGMDSFRVVLARTPASNVTISLTQDLSGEVILEPTRLTFTPANWNTPQTVTATGLDDNIRDLNRTVTVTLTPESQDPNYADALPGTTFVVNTDNEKDVAIFQDGFE